jgi:predicted solute-binding protein
MLNQLSFQKFKRTLTELKEDSPKDTAEFKKLSPAEKQAVKDVFTLLGNTKGEIITKVDSIIKQVAKKRNVKVSAIEDYFDNEILS